VRVVKGKTLAEVYQHILYDIMTHPEYTTNPRGQETREVANLIIEIEDPLMNMVINKKRSTPNRYLAGELWWYLNDQSNKIGSILPFSQFWSKITNPDGETVNSNYGHLLFNQHCFAPDRFFYGEGRPRAHNEWSWALESLKADRYSRQAIIHFNKPHHMFPQNKDFPCTVAAQFMIRAERLFMTVYMRSQDEILGRIFDVPFFTVLQQQMLSHLKDTYPYLKLGSYIQHNGSSHIYENNFGLVHDMLGEDFTPNGLPALSEDLVLHDGTPSTSLKMQNLDDPLINWIVTNMKADTLQR
jgi:thymidylate synthase